MDTFGYKEQNVSHNDTAYESLSLPIINTEFDPTSFQSRTGTLNEM